MKVGVLALQGDFERHRERLSELGAIVLLVRKPSELRAVRGLVIPGGESTTLLKLMDDEFRTALREFVGEGKALLATCAGIILIAENVSSPEQESFRLLDIDVERNGYGRQIDSFIDDSLQWTPEGSELLQEIPGSAPNRGNSVEGVFIRAPKIIRMGSTVSVLMERDGDPVLIKQNNILGATFHPELSESARAVHELFLANTL